MSSIKAGAACSWMLSEIRAEMARRRLSQAALASAVGLSQAGLARRLNGHVDLTVGELVRIAGALGTSPESLVAVAAQDRAAS